MVNREDDGTANVDLSSSISAHRPDQASLGAKSPTLATKNPTHATGDKDTIESDVMLDLLLQARRQAIAKMKELINDGKLYSPILLMWICKEALVAQDQDMQPFHDPVTLYVDFSRSRGPLIRLFDRFCEANFELAKEANPDGCLAWDQIKTLSQKEELSCFGFKKMSSNSKDFRRAILGKNINNDSEDYVRAITGKMRFWYEVKLRAKLLSK
ncbi:hypothetical protein L13192_01899 [Pyrenophora tritici-repentis]|nr:hypothetical protein L13192_01899 [Pyrenophora tritici-repentis]